MIFVTIGSDKQFGFERLIEACDAAAAEIKNPMVMQTAVTKYKPKNAEIFPYSSISEYLQYFEKADLIISHCSIGPVVNAARFQKPLIVFPRRFSYGELADEHQLDFARTLDAKKIPHIKVVYETKDLKAAIQTFLDHKPEIAYNREGRSTLIHRIKEFIQQVEKETGLGHG